MRPTALCLPILLALAATAPAQGAALDKTGTQWSPYLEWRLHNPTVEGNPFDLIATATFRHAGSGETHRTEMFYAGDDTWAFRFTGTRPGLWRFTTASADPDLDGRAGSVTIRPNPDPEAHGFVKSFGNKWGWSGTETAFVPQLVMWNRSDDLGQIHRRPNLIDVDIAEFLGRHGFNGFHVTSISKGWFDIDHRWRKIDASLTEPDRRTFEALEQMIARVHAAGGVIHIWIWGDEQRGWTPRRLQGGVNGPVERRLMRYIAARLGPLPGWTMGYGFDLHEWSTASEVRAWHDFMQSKLGWFHFLGGRPGGPRHGTNHYQYVPWNRPLDYSSYEHHHPTYEVYVAALRAIPGQPVISEDRFRVRSREKDYNEIETRRGLYQSTMAGGVGNIWGYLRNETGRYPSRVWIRTYSEFFRRKGRFTVDSTPANRLSKNLSTRVLRSGNDQLIFYREDAPSIHMNLSVLGRPRRAVAVDTRRPYAEVDLGKLEPRELIWSAPYRSDWIVSVGEDGPREARAR